VSPGQDGHAAYSPSAVARAFVGARQAGVAMTGFPGPLPPDMAAGYATQAEAMALWPDEVAGWKVGRIASELVGALGADRIAGPVFRRNVWRAVDGEATFLPVIEGGFAAVEAEYIYRIGQDAPPGKADWSPHEALGLVEDQLVGVEFAGSPLAEINALGPRVVAADFGNNSGLVLGRSVPDWKSRTDDWPPVEAYVAGKLVGRGAPSSLPGGPPAALAFLANLCAERAMPLKRGQLVSTGAASGIHKIVAGQAARIVFDGLGEIHCLAEAARPAERERGGSVHERRNARS
jgi:2-keto-4-pentenoate hydratase